MIIDKCRRVKAGEELKLLPPGEGGGVVLVL